MTYKEGSGRAATNTPRLASPPAVPPLAGESTGTAAGKAVLASSTKNVRVKTPSTSLSSDAKVPSGKDAGGNMRSRGQTRTPGIPDTISPRHSSTSNIASPGSTVRQQGRTYKPTRSWASTTFASMLENVSPTQNKDGSYDYLGLNKDGDAHLTTIHSCGAPTLGGSRTPSGMAGITGAAKSTRGRARALDHRLSGSSTLASPVPALADISTTQNEDGSYACLELSPDGEARLSTMQSTGPHTLGGSRAPPRAAVVPRAPATSRKHPPLDAHLTDIQETRGSIALSGPLSSRLDSSRRIPPLDAHLTDIQQADETGVSINADLADTGARNEQGFTPASSDSVFLPPPEKVVTSIVRTAPHQTTWKGAAWTYTLYGDKGSVDKSTDRKRGRRGGVNNKKTPPPSTRPPTRTTPKAVTLRETKAPRPTSPPRGKLQSW